MSLIHIDKTVIRKSFGKIKDIVQVPDLIGIQSKSFNDFAQLDELPVDRRVIGLEKVLKDIFPIEYEDKMSLEYVSYELGHWSCTCGKLVGITHRYTWSCSSCNQTGCSRLSDRLDCPQCSAQTAHYKTCENCLARVTIQVPMNPEECRSSGQTFLMPLKIKIQLLTWGADQKGNRVVRDIKEQDIFFCDIPVMLDLYEANGRIYLGSLGTFVINGVDRVVVSQLHRSPGVVFAQSKKIKDFRGRPYYLARIIPMRGSWLDFEFDSNDLLYVRIDKKKKMLVTTFLQALGVAREKIIPTFYLSDRINCVLGVFSKPVDASLIGQRIEKGVLPEKVGGQYVGMRFTADIIKKLQDAGVATIQLSSSMMQNRILASDLVNPVTGELLAEQGAQVSELLIERCSMLKSINIDLIVSSGYVFQPTIAVTLTHDRCMNREEALKEIHAKVWPGDNSSLREIQQRLEDLLYSSRLYDLTRVGRIRMNRKLNLTIPENIEVLTLEDIIASLRYLVNLRELGEGELDDIDHLGNRRVRLVGELLSNQVYLGFLRIERIVRERFRMQEMNTTLMPQDFLSVKPLGAVLREFFGTGQLSQFMDQTNPLSEIAHKRRLSALGPGGIMKDRATFEIRDVHTSHYGRICPIETPEGQTVGLISSLATYAKVNELGFIETAYRTVTKGRVKEDVVFLDAFQEGDKYIAQSDSKEGKKGLIEGDRVFARHDGDFMYVEADKVQYVDLSPKQLVSVSTALIPFLEHDDASRALMGSNMQRQAVPLIKNEPPIVGTGMEKEIAISSGALIVASHPGVVEYVDSEKVMIRVDESIFPRSEEWINRGIQTYYLKKFQMSTHSTWVHQKPAVSVGSRVEVGDVLSTGPAVERGELALGTNLLVAFMPWRGYNFEDAIVLNKRLIADDVFTSVHIDEYSVDARDTKLGPEEITRDIPNVSDSALQSLDEDGIVKVGTRVQAGDIIVGKVTLKGDIQYSPEEKLLRAIFGEKSREVRDTSLRVPPGVEGTVVDVKVFSRSGIRKDKRYKDVVAKQVEKLDREYSHHQRFLAQMVIDASVKLIAGKTAEGKAASKFLTDMTFDAKKLLGIEFEQLVIVKTTDKKINAQLEKLRLVYENQLRILSGLKEERINKLKKGDPLPSGVIKMVKVYIASKRSIAVGDKIAGRHGNKGVVSTIVPREDMPYLDDGTVVDVVLNPLGVPSRMNVGQILETILAFAGRQFNSKLLAQAEQKADESVEQMLSYYYGAPFIADYKKQHGRDGLFELAQRTYKNGIYFKTPVFDGASFDEDIKPLLDELNLPASGAFRLRDGRTGEYFDQPITVGSIYMMKLDHMVDDKLHARSVGPYSLVTQQPLGGKAQMGGQRFGEMEVWALEAYGAAYTLQEMLTYKSDDVNGRPKVYDAIVHGEEVPEPGLPESFNVLIKELQSLGLHVDLFKSGKEEICE